MKTALAPKVTSGDVIGHQWTMGLAKLDDDEYELQLGWRPGDCERCHFPGAATAEHPYFGGLCGDCAKDVRWEDTDYDHE